MSDQGHPELRKRSETRKRTALVAVRLLPHERDALVAAAQARNVTISELLRTSALQATET